jgi:hypothetical protein
MGAACTLNLDLSTSVCRKHLKVGTVTTKGIETSTQIIIIEEQFICNAKDGHTCEKQ